LQKRPVILRSLRIVATPYILFQNESGDETKETYKKDGILQKRPIIIIDPTDRSHPTPYMQGLLIHFEIIYMGWLRLVGYLKLQVSFAKEPYKRDDILHKRPKVESGDSACTYIYVYK